MHFCKKSLDFLKFLVDIVTRIRRRREPPFQSLPCRTGRTARFDFATQNLSGRGRSIPAPIQENRWVFRRPVTISSSFPCKPDLFVVNAVHGFGVRLPGGNAGEPFCVLGLGADFSPQLQHRLQREAGAAGHHLGSQPSDRRFLAVSSLVW